jgi:hypothetical protein
MLWNHIHRQPGKYHMAGACLSPLSVAAWSPRSIQVAGLAVRDFHAWELYP